MFLTTHVLAGYGLAKIVKYFRRGDIKTVEIWLAVIIAGGIDFDHYSSWLFIKDAAARIFGPGVRNPGLIWPACWLHRWPGAILALALGLAGVVLKRWTGFKAWYLPFLAWASHYFLDALEARPGGTRDLSFFYPWIKHSMISFGFIPKKTPAEIIGSSVCLIVFFLWWYYHRKQQ